jgi:glutathione synthase/RimK-type ligase-like ATP-grasp enzyme
MMLYIDDDTADATLILALRRAGHDVRTPAEAGLSGAKDPVHLKQAIREGRRLWSHNYDDFKKLHELVVEAQGRHPGVLVIRNDGPRRHNMKSHDITRALHKLEGAGVPIANEYTILNHWR